MASLMLFGIKLYAAVPSFSSPSVTSWGEESVKRLRVLSIEPTSYTEVTASLFVPGRAACL